MTNGLVIRTRADIEKARKAFQVASPSQLREQVTKLDAMIRARRRRLGISDNYDAVVSAFAERDPDLLTHDRDRLPYVPALALNAMMDRPDRAFPVLPHLPAHAWMALDTFGTRSAPETEHYLPEAMLFEDMAAFYNRSVQLLKTVESQRPRKRDIKELNATRRACVLAAFYFVEAYLNGIAFDFLAEIDQVEFTKHVVFQQAYDHGAFVSRHPEMSHDDLDLLLECNCKRDKAEQFVAFEKKCIQYPRIASRQADAGKPPIQEANCPELKYLLNEAKSLRDAIVHQSPRVEPLTPEQGKQLRFFDFANYSLTRDICGQVVDHAIRFVRRVDAALRWKPGEIDDWLIDRAPGGSFPESVFT